MSRAMVLLSFLLLAFNALAGSTPAKLFSVMNERLSYMEDVALYKAINHIAIEDLDREKTVIESAAKSAASLGLDSHSVEALFSAQISAAKAIQYRYRADLLSTPETKKPRDLTSVIRPALIRLGKQINEELAAYLQEGGSFSDKDWEIFDASLSERYLSPADKKVLFDALGLVRLQ